jgi:hypothetical protein
VREVIRGESQYVDPDSGAVYELPNLHDAYHLDRYGTPQPGHVNGLWGTNLYPQRP